MRNVATRDNIESNLKENKWSSMPAIALNSISSQEEELQEVAGRLEIRVVPKEQNPGTKDDALNSPVKIINEVSTKPVRDRKTEIIEQELKANSNHGSKESITENTVQKQADNITKEITNLVQKIDALPVLDKALEQVHCVLNVEKYEINRSREEKEPPVDNDLIKNNIEEKIIENNVSPVKLINSEVSPKESVVTNEKDDQEDEAEEAKHEVNELVSVERRSVDNNVKTMKKEEVQKCSPCIDLTTHPSVTFVPPTSNIQPENVR